MTKEEWEDLILTSHYLANVEIKNQLEKGNYEQAKIGLEMLTEAQKDWHQMQLLFKLKDLMFHLLLGLYIPQKRTSKWNAKLTRLRHDFEDEQEFLDILNNDYVRTIWEEAFEMALDLIKIVVKNKLIQPLTWEEVFEKKYPFRGEKEWQKQRRLSKAS